MKTRLNGISLAFDTAGSGSAVVLLHGFPLDRRMWRLQVPALVAAGYRVVTPDLRGFGESDKGDEPLTLSLFADDIAALLDYLEIEQAVIGGMSMGGYVLLDLLARYPARVRAPLFLMTRAGADDEAGKTRRTALAAEIRSGRPQVAIEAFEKILFAEETPRLRPDLVAEVGEWMAGTAPETLAGALLAMRDRPDCTALLPRFDLPALVVAAEQDRAAPPEQGEILARGLPRAQLRRIAGAGHMANLEQPAAFNRHLLDFLDALPPA